MRSAAVVFFALSCAACATAEGGGAPTVEDTGAEIVAYPDDTLGDDASSDALFGIDDSSTHESAIDSAPIDDGAPPPDTFVPPADTAPPCTTTITYGAAWIHPSGHPGNTDDTSGLVTWDGSCTTAATNSFATLSNGWKPYFSGAFSCTMALDDTCTAAPTCTTRITYGPAWIHPTGHPAQFDDAGGHVTWDGVCTASGSNSYATLSNGWKPFFTGTRGCAMAMRYVDCGGL